MSMQFEAAKYVAHPGMRRGFIRPFLFDPTMLFDTVEFHLAPAEVRLISSHGGMHLALA